MKIENHSDARAASRRLERSCAINDGDWIRDQQSLGGVSILRASLRNTSYARHRHDTYTIALTDSGIQEFNYRGSVHRSLPGQVVVLHPDEAHDGRPGDARGFSYRTIYVDPAYLLEAARAQCPGFTSLPFIKNPVVGDSELARLVADAFSHPLEPLSVHELIQTISARLILGAQNRSARTKHRAVSELSLVRTQEFLDANFSRVVAADELERVSGESRYCLGSQFKRRFRTSPYRYLMMRRVDFVRAKLLESVSLAGVSYDAGFADQAHTTRVFKSIVGITPNQYARACRSR